MDTFKRGVNTIAQLALKATEVGDYVERAKLLASRILNDFSKDQEDLYAASLAIFLVISSLGDAAQLSKNKLN